MPQRRNVYRQDGTPVTLVLVNGAWVEEDPNSPAQPFIGGIPRPAPQVGAPQVEEPAYRGAPRVEEPAYRGATPSVTPTPRRDPRLGSAPEKSIRKRRSETLYGRKMGLGGRPPTRDSIQATKDWYALSKTEKKREKERYKNHRRRRPRDWSAL